MRRLRAYGAEGAPGLNKDSGVGLKGFRGLGLRGLGLRGFRVEGVSGLGLRV